MRGYQGLPVGGFAKIDDIVRVVNGILQGKLNVVADVDIPNSLTSILVRDGRISPQSLILVQPGSTITGVEYIELGVSRLTVTSGVTRKEKIVIIG